MNRIYPEITTSSKRTPAFKKRIKNIGKWVAVMAGLPIAYVMMPFSCCIRNPVASKVLDKENVLGPPMTAGEKMGENLGVGVFSAMTWVSCGCCCFGKCGAVGPNDV